MYEKSLKMLTDYLNKFNEGLVSELLWEAEVKEKSNPSRLEGRIISGKARVFQIWPDGKGFSEYISAVKPFMV